MADLRYRSKYYGLPTQQRRLRHLRSLAARNVHHADIDEVTDFEIFFTLHQQKTSKAFYTSEKIRGSLNPTWKSFNLEHLTLGGVDTARSLCVVKIWRGWSGTYCLCLEWEVDLTGLVFSGDKLLGKSVQYAEDTVLFGMFEGFYIAPTQPLPQIERPLSDYEKEVDESLVKVSYSTGTLSRIQTILRATVQTHASVGKVRSNIEQKLQHSRYLQQKRSALEMSLLRVNMIRKDLERRTAKLQKEKEDFEALQASSYTKEISLKNKFETLHKDKVRLHDKKKGYFDVREELIKSGAQLVMRRKQLISELAFIYPIQEQEHIHSVAGVKLPNSEDFAGHNDTMIEVSLGHTCHLVSMISHFLDVPVRYPMEQRGSRSTIRDHIMEKLHDREREFPLYTKGKERFQFNYGVYLLNKNIAQLRYYCGLGTTDLRLTLPNLKSLLQLRLGVKFESSSTPHNALAHQHLAVPPNLGGPQAMTSPSFAQPQPAKKAAPLQHRDVGKEFEQLLKETKVKSKKGDESSSVNSDNSQDSSINHQHHSEDSSENSLPPNSLPKKSTAESEGKFKENIPNSVVPNDLDASGSHRTMKTLDQLSRERLLGPLTNYDDLEVSSSEDSTNATYGSKFKMWPRSQGDSHSSPEKDAEVNEVHRIEDSPSHNHTISSSSISAQALTESDLESDVATFTNYRVAGIPNESNDTASELTVEKEGQMNKLVNAIDEHNSHSSVAESTSASVNVNDDDEKTKTAVCDNSGKDDIIVSNVNGNASTSNELHRDCVVGTSGIYETSGTVVCDTVDDQTEVAEEAEEM